MDSYYSVDLDRGFAGANSASATGGWHRFSPLAMPPSGWVLVHVMFDNNVAPKTLIAYYSRDGRWRTSFGQVSGTVTHWMPLPEPPEKGE